MLRKNFCLCSCVLKYKKWEKETVLYSFSLLLPSCDFSHFFLSIFLSVREIDGLSLFPSLSHRLKSRFRNWASILIPLWMRRQEGMFRFRTKVTLETYTYRSFHRLFRFVRTLKRVIEEPFELLAKLAVSFPTVQQKREKKKCPKQILLFDCPTLADASLSLPQILS